MTTYAYMVDSFLFPLDVQRAAIKWNHKPDVEIVDHMSQLVYAPMNRTNAKKMFMQCRTGDTIVIFDWVMAYNESKSRTDLLTTFLDNRMITIVDAAGRGMEAIDKDTKDMHMQALAICGLLPQEAPLPKEPPPGWRKAKKKGEFLRDEKERLFARMLLALVCDYGFTPIDILRCIKRRPTGMINAAQRGFPTDERHDPVFGTAGHRLVFRRKQYRTIMKILGDGPLSTGEMFNAMRKHRVTFPAGRLFEMRSCGLIKRRWDLATQKWVYERNFACKTWHYDTMPYEILHAIQSEPMEPVTLAVMFREPRWYILEILGLKCLRRKLAITRSRRGRVSFKLKCHISDIDFEKVKDELGIKQTCSWDARTFLSLAPEDESLPFDPLRHLSFRAGSTLHSWRTISSTKSSAS